MLLQFSVWWCLLDKVRTYYEQNPDADCPPTIYIFAPNFYLHFGGSGSGFRLPPRLNLFGKTGDF